MVSNYVEVKFMSVFSVTTSLFFVLNALGNVPFFVGILSSYSVKHQRRIILREMLVALGILVVVLMIRPGGLFSATRVRQV